MMATTDNFHPETAEQSVAVVELNQLMNTADSDDIRPGNTLGSEVDLVGVMSDHGGKSLEVHTCQIGESIGIETEEGTFNRSKKINLVSKVSGKTNNSATVQDTSVNRQPFKLTDDMKRGIRLEKKKKLKELLDLKLHCLGLPRKKGWEKSRPLKPNTNKKSFECSTCEKCFDSAEDLSAHEQAVHTNDRLLAGEENVFRCLQCGHDCTDENRLNHHMLQHSKNTFICAICGKSLKNQKSLRQHTTVHIEERRYECPLCKITFKHKNNLYRHRKRRTCELTNVCSVCEIEFKHKVTLQVHMTRMHGIKPPAPDRPHVCQCGAAFRTPGALRQHMQRLHGIEPEDIPQKKHYIQGPERPYVCQCGIAFKESHHLAFHEKKIHGIVQSIRSIRVNKNPKKSQADKDKNFECRTCKKFFQTSKSLLRHEESDFHAQNRYLCSFCGKTFSRHWLLLDHQKRHTGEKVFLCTHCGYQCKNRSTLHYHMESHSDKKFFCDICDSSFTNKINLRSHQIVHTDKRPFPCTECEKTFKTRAVLKSHSIVHMTDRPHVCWCGHAFKVKSALNRHTRRIHGTPKADQQNSDDVEIFYGGTNC